jgi:predicted  nucleic acid-binding Zn-ribbon protein
MQDPIVPVHGTSCSSCFYTIIKQDYANLKKVGMLPCRNCYRLLYLDTDTNTDINTENQAGA